MARDAAIREFVEAAEKYGQAQLVGNARISNREYDVLTALYEEIRDDYQSYALRCQTLLSHENGYVRLHAACCLIPVSPAEAKVVLTQLSSERGALGFSAKITLREWDNGRLRI